MTVLIFDIETIPDLDSGRRIYNLTELDDENTGKAMMALRREKVGHDFLPHHLQKIIAISVLLKKSKTIKLWSLGTEEDDEKELISRFFAGIDKYCPSLVSWNGSGFDLPVLHYRALLHGIPSKKYWDIGEGDSAFRWNNYLNRFHLRHLDLMDLLAGYQNKAFAPLDDIATMLGFSGKIGMDGSHVFDAWRNGELTAIRNYCEADVLNTYAVYLRFELIRGLINPEEYQSSIEELKAYLETEPQKTHWQEFAAIL